MMNAHAPLKWVGGKSWLGPTLLPFIPDVINTYYEPFVGGGSVFWALAQANTKINRVVLNDSNEELIDLYRVIRDFPEELIRELEPLLYDKELYYWIRAQNPETLEPVRRAARTVFLNKNCFNGLYRVNKAGQFNVPFGRYTNPTICDEENIRACSKVLQKAELHSGDFADVVSEAGPGDVVYFDPPYVPLNPTSNFTSYTSDGFGLRDQERLAICFKELAGKRVNVYLSNSDTPLVRELYGVDAHEFEFLEVQARRSINSNASKRGKVGELLVMARSEEDR
jgi:DNA adenine methylase